MTKSNVTYAVIRVGGQQYKVSTGDSIVVDRVDAEEGKSVTYDMKPNRDDPTAVGTKEMGQAIVEKIRRV